MRIASRGFSPPSGANEFPHGRRAGNIRSCRPECDADTIDMSMSESIFSTATKSTLESEELDAFCDTALTAPFRPARNFSGRLIADAFARIPDILLSQYALTPPYTTRPNASMLLNDIPTAAQVERPPHDLPARVKFTPNTSPAASGLENTSANGTLNTTLNPESVSVTNAEAPVRHPSTAASGPEFLRAAKTPAAFAEYW